MSGFCFFIAISTSDETKDKLNTNLYCFKKFSGQRPYYSFKFHSK